MLQMKDYIRERDAVKRKMVKNVEENKKLRLQLKPLNQLIAAAGAEETSTNGNGHQEEVDLPFQCDQEGCTKSFAGPQPLGMHKFRAHGIRNPRKKSGAKK